MGSVERDGHDFVDIAELTLADLRHRIGLDSWWIARQRGDDQVVVAAVDDTFGRTAGTVVAWADSFCVQMLHGDAPQAAGRVEDVPAYVYARQRNLLPAAALLALPLIAPDGAVVGTLCAASRSPHEHLEELLPTVQVQASMLGALLAHELRLADEVRRAERAERAAHTDALTEVGNRRSWDAALAAEEVRAARYASATSVLIVDVDGLKAVNDSAGHHAGDDLLRATAALLGQRVRDSDLVARLGGDEFGLLLTETDLAGANALAQQLRTLLSAAQVQASIGVATRTGDDGLLGVWRAADAAMYAEKIARKADDRRAASFPAAPVADQVAAATTRATPDAVVPAAPEAKVSSSVDDLLRLITAQLGTEVAFVNTFDGENRRFRNLVSTIDLPIAVGDVTPRAGTYCQLIADEALETVVPDALVHPLVKDLPITQTLGIGSYLGVPLHRASGELYGTLCSFSQTSDPGLRERDSEVLTAIAAPMMRLIETEDNDVTQRHAVLARLQRLLDGGGPDIVYQPIVRLHGMQAIGVEALSRFPADTASPAQWFADATKAGAALDLELRALANACADLDELDGLLTLNASPATICSPRFARALHGQPLRRLVLEITEHEPVQDYSPLLTALAPLRAAGLRIAVDDTGAGFASMRHVLALVPDLIKLDISLVRGIDTDLARQALTAALVTFAAATGAEVIAEGVETVEELDCLRDLGIDYAQGYYLARPAPLATHQSTLRR